MIRICRLLALALSFCSLHRQRLPDDRTKDSLCRAEVSGYLSRDSVSEKQGEKRGTRYSFRYSGRTERQRLAAKLLENLEARVGIEPTHKGFADLSLTTWVPRLWVGYSLGSPSEL
jgi:hypothetical protein